MTSISFTKGRFVLSLIDIKNTKSQLVASNYHDYCEEIKGIHKRFYNEKNVVKVP